MSLNKVIVRLIRIIRALVASNVVLSTKEKTWMLDDLKEMQEEISDDQ